MGRGMATRLIGAGHDVALFDREAAAVDALAETGGRATSSIADLCAGREVVITMLVDDGAVGGVVLDPGGLRDSLPAGAVHLVMGTHGVAMVRELAAVHAAAGQALVAAPVLGRPDLAASGHLGIVIGGEPAAAARCRPLFEAMGRRRFTAGVRPESAAAIKLANNAVLGCAIVAMAEGFALVRKYGVDPHVLFDVMTDGLFAAPAYVVYGRKMVDETFDEVGSPIHVGLKDANLIAAAAELAGVPMPAHEVYRERLRGALAHGDGDRDQAVLAREQARASGLFEPAETEASAV